MEQGVGEVIPKHNGISHGTCASRGADRLAPNTHEFVVRRIPA
jgi:hypothetical protein